MLNFGSKLVAQAYNVSYLITYYCVYTAGYIYINSENVTLGMVPMIIGSINTQSNLNGEIQLLLFAL